MSTITPHHDGLFDGRFVLLESVGQGGMAQVFKATDTQTGALIALKIPLEQLDRDSVFRERFQREIDIGRTLDHPGIIKTIHVDQPGRLYLAMEYVEGRTLWDRMQHERPIPTDEALRIARLLCDALEHMEQHEVYHRDLKPTNVMLCRDGSIRIMDFGVAMTATARRLTLAGAKGIGTPEYMAPEQITGRRGDHRADIYSVGAMLYEMTTGRRPYDEQPDMYTMTNARLIGDPVAPRVYNPALSEQVEEIVLHALARTPDDRYRRAAEFSADLASPERVTMTGRASRLKPVKIRSEARVIVYLIVAALLLPIALFFLFLLLFSHR